MFALGLKGNDTFIALGGYDNLNGGEGFDTYDLTNAQGTKVINNTAEDGIADTIILPYDARLIRFERLGSDLVLRIVSTRFYPNNNTEPFNACNRQDPPEEVDLYPPFNNTNCTSTTGRNIVTEGQESLSDLNIPERKRVGKEEMSNQLNSVEKGRLPFQYSTKMKKRGRGRGKGRGRGRGRGRGKGKGRGRGSGRGSTSGTKTHHNLQPIHHLLMKNLSFNYAKSTIQIYLLSF